MTAKPKTQAQKFRETARELETDDSEKHFNEKLGKIAKQAAKPSAPDVKKARK
jgi:hypothetical protein